MDVSIIIVNLNSRQLLQDCLRSIYEQSREVAFEVIVVDNYSTDGSVEMVTTEFPQVRLIANEVNNRYAIANNQGLTIAQGKYVFYLNGDTILTGNTVKEFVAFLDAHPEAGGVGGHLIYPNGDFQNACFRFPSALNVFYMLCLARFYWETPLAANYRFPSGSITPQPVDFMVGACFMARHDVLNQCCGMDEDYYFYGEDSDLCYRIWQTGWPIYYLPNSTKIIHYGGISSTINLFNNNQRTKHLWGWKSRFLFIKKHYPLWRRMLILLAVFSAFGMNAAFYSLGALKRRNWEYLRVNLQAYTEITQTGWKILFGEN
jgi:GT2 family glycosyltransferase